LPSIHSFIGPVGVAQPKSGYASRVMERDNALEKKVLYKTQRNILRRNERHLIHAIENLRREIETLAIENRDTRQSRDYWQQRAEAAEQAASGSVTDTETPGDSEESETESSE